MSETRFYHFTGKGMLHRLKTHEEAIMALGGGGFIWIDFFKPEIGELHSLVDTLGVHPLSVEDCLDSSQMPKIEHFPGNTFMIFKDFSYKDKMLYIDEVDFFIGKNFLVTVSGTGSDDRRPLNNIINIIEKDPGIARSEPAFLLHVILDYVVDQKFHAFENLEDELELAEDQIIDAPDKFRVNELLRIRKDLLNLRKNLYHEREILVKICRMDCPFIAGKAIFAFRDVYDHLVRFFELSENYREIVTSLMELYSSLLNNMMTKVSNETNATMRRLTFITTIFMPLTLIASIGGMSEYTMITGGDNWKTSYLLLTAGLVLIAVISYFFLRSLERRKKRH
ncbi:MAG TPA: magnesium transporter CorA family protein [Bacteroidales bacterium]|jgi:magnesium transporter|nr:magnesium transporter CorA family protein [Bacteroidales bacterium]HOS72805.1 magnesium transporter CorA family protein [Bacteroidales bacterium]HQH24824.1 magnesium transporter CorA family protein [Bacteroidales bacterium]